MFGLKRIIKMKVYSDYKSARKVADDIILSLSRNIDTNGTFTSTIKMSFGYVFEGSKAGPYNRYNAKWIIRIFKCEGNRYSILSPSQNSMFNAILTVHDAEKTMEDVSNLPK